MVCNKDIRNYAKKNHIKLWEIAEKLGMHDSNFSRKLRKELHNDEKRKVIAIIEELKGGEQNAK